jgi:hypothetical protein
VSSIQTDDAGDPDKRKQAKRKPDPRSQRIGEMIALFMRMLPRTTEALRSDSTHMSLAEGATAYKQAEARITGRKRERGDSYISKILRGEIKPTLERLSIIRAALRLKPWQYALLKEMAGFEGFAEYYALGLGIPPTRSVWELLTLVEQGELKIEECQLMLDEQIQTVKDNLERRVRAEYDLQLATQRSEHQAELRALTQAHEQELAKQEEDLKAAYERKLAKLEILHEDEVKKAMLDTMRKFGSESRNAGTESESRNTGPGETGLPGAT